VTVTSPRGALSPRRLPREPRRVVIADDHPFYRAGLAGMLERSGIEVVAEVANGEAAIRAVEQTAPDVVVMDLNMPGVSGIEATKHLAERAPASRVLVLSVSAEDADVTDAILAGASGYVLKDCAVEEIVTAIDAIACGRSLLSPRIAQMLLRRLGEDDGVAHELSAVRLSPRERSVLELMAEGQTDHEIALVLEVDAAVVRNSLSSVLLKLQADTRVRTAMRSFQAAKD
jgi:DNA-binding NarL/FixJ family response regulator